jgi:hypothetical protein
MGRTKPRKSEARFYTPPPEIQHPGGEHVKTPSRAVVIAAKLLGQELGRAIPQDIVRRVSGVPESVQSRISFNGR